MPSTTSFLTRVELHDGTAEDYAKLDTIMQSIGFSRTVRANADSVGVYLPTGNYVGTGELTAGQVSQMAQGAALRTKKGFAVLVSDSTTLAWFGLEPAIVPPPPAPQPA
jgi:hypothetical protein